MVVALQLVGVASVPLNATVLLPCVAPKFVPEIVTEVPTAPEFGFTLAMLVANTVVVVVEELEQPRKPIASVVVAKSSQMGDRRRFIIKLHAPKKLGKFLRVSFANKPRLIRLRYSITSYLTEAKEIELYLTPGGRISSTRISSLVEYFSTSRLVCPEK